MRITLYIFLMFLAFLSVITALSGSFAPVKEKQKEPFEEKKEENPFMNLINAGTINAMKANESIKLTRILSLIVFGICVSGLIVLVLTA